MPLTPEGEAKLKAAFAEADKNGDNKLNLDEFGKMIRFALGASEADFPPERILQMFSDWQQVNDKIGGPSELTLEEVLTEMNKPPATNEGLVALFKEWDKDGSGKISTEELKIIYRKMGHSDETAQKAIEEADANNDNEIDLNEFIKFLG